MKILPSSAAWKTLLLGLPLLLGMVTSACETAFSKVNAKIQQYNLQGRVEFVDQKNSGITVAHEDIPGFMPAMTMLFKVKDKALLNHVRVGDQIKAVVAYDRQTKETWLQQIVVVQKAAQR